jgi:hypothetical protein
MAKKSVIEISDIISVAQDLANRHSCDGAISCPLKSSFMNLGSDIKLLARSARGLCLDCINAERETTGLNMLPSNKTGCRVGHGENPMVVLDMF